MSKFISKNSHFLLLISIVIAIYYKFFLFGKIPFPGDLLIASYSPWFDYYKLPVQNPLISDVFSQFFLWKHLAVDIIKNGEWPLWNPYSFTGNPLLATYHSATLYPLNILLLLPKYWGWGLFIFSQTIMAAFSMYLLLSIWIGSKLARLTGAIIFAFGGLMTTWLELGTAGHAIAWLPLSIYFIERYFHNFRLRYLLLLIISQTLLILAGHAQNSIYAFIVLFLFLLLRSLCENLKRFFIYFFPPFLSLCISLLIVTPQLLPTLDLLNKSIRLTESYTDTSNFGLLPIKNFLRFIAADFFGHPVTRNYWGFLNYSETSGFMGTLTLPLILFSYIYLKRGKVIIFFLILLPVSLLFTFDNFISHTIYSLKIPILTSSYAGRMLFMTTFSSAILSAFAINQLVKEHYSEKRFMTLISWIWSAAAGLSIGSILAYQIVQNIIKAFSSNIQPGIYLDSYLNDGNYILSYTLVAVRNSLIPFVLISIFFVLIFLIGKIQLRILQINRITLMLILLFIFNIFDLGRYFLKFNTFVAQELILPEVPAIHFLQKQPGIFRFGREHAEVFPPNTWTAYNLQSLEGYDPLYLNEYAKFMHFLNGGDLRTGSFTRYAELSETYHSPYIDAANVKFFIGVLRDKKGAIPGDLIDYRLKETAYKKVFQDKSAVILENPNASERVYFASSFRTDSKAQIENIIMTDSKFDPRKEILLSKDLSISSVTGTGKAEITQYSPNSVNIVTQTQSDEILVLADQYDEGWKATIDGKETEISPANLIFRAIKVPAGSHEIIFKYSPKSFNIGLKISLITILLTFLISLAAKKGKLLIKLNFHRINKFF